MILKNHKEYSRRDKRNRAHSKVIHPYDNVSEQSFRFFQNHIPEVLIQNLHIISDQEQALHQKDDRRSRLKAAKAQKTTVTSWTARMIPALFKGYLKLFEDGNLNLRA